MFGTESNDRERSVRVCVGYRSVYRLLGVNNHDIAVGFFTNASGINRGYTYNIATKTLSRVLPPGASDSSLGASLTATAINNNGDVAGFYLKQGRTDAFLAVGSQVWLLDDGTNTSPIAKTGLLTSANEGPYPLEPFESGFPLGSLRGHATIVYDPDAQTIAVTLTASGLSPGPHAVGIRVGYCTSQGPALFTPKDFAADSRGNITGQTHVITGVTVGMPSTSWYLSVH